MLPVKLGRFSSIAGYDDLAAWRQGDSRRPIIGVLGKVGRDLSALAEAVVEGAVRVVTGKGEFARAGRRRTDGPSPARNNQLAVGLNCERTGAVHHPAEVGQHPSAGAEGLVERAVHVVAGEREVEAGHVVRLGSAGRDDLAVRLECDRICNGIHSEARHYFAFGAEASVEFSGARVPRDGELRLEGDQLLCPSGGYHLAVGLDGYA
jgi:hypothetical protein